MTTASSSTTTTTSSSGNNNIAVTSSLARLIWPLLIRPALNEIGKRNTQIARSLTVALVNAENRNPGLLLEMIQALLAIQHAESSDPTISMITASVNECLLRAQRLQPSPSLSSQSMDDNYHQDNISQTRTIDIALQRETYALKRLLSRIPDQVNDRQPFLGTIREIASSIKRLLDTIDRHHRDSGNNRRTLAQSKRQLIRDSKQFSQILKNYFKGEANVEDLFRAAIQLIYVCCVIDKMATETV